MVAACSSLITYVRLTLITHQVMNGSNDLCHALQTAPLRETQPDGSRHPFDTFICAKTPSGRWGDPDDMVGPCVFLASHASDFVNGQILYADGGILAYIGRQPK